MIDVTMSLTLAPQGNAKAISNDVDLPASNPCASQRPAQEHIM